MGFLDAAVSIAQQSGDLLKERFGHQVSFRLKADKTYVSEADMASHELIKQQIRKHFPSHHILSEEDSSYERLSGGDVDQLQNEYLWVVDPLDGTSNFIHHIPYFAVSIACLNMLGSGHYECLVGVTYNPITKELYYGEKGHGVWKKSNNHNYGEAKTTRLDAMKPCDLHEAFVACGFHGDADSPGYEKQYTSLIKATESSRRLGAAALDTARVSEGIFHLFFDPHVKIWDYVAGSLFVEELGGISVPFSVQENLIRSVHQSGVICGHPHVVTEALKLI
ncbi:MAG: inositol monophosphatase [Proteobacteria bacterium]|nr:inositol monophosphatase [Pseudomonadota bacterium]